MTATAGTRAGPSEEALVAAALAGDDAAFRELTRPYERELHIHCYRMLGSLHDAEDALQETLLRAWRHLASFQARSTFRAWLYRVATNVCLTSAERQRAALLSAPPPFALPPDELVLSPYPDELLDALPSASAGPGAAYDLRESVQLAFLATIQALPPRQRAVLILRDVLGWTAREAAELLESSTAGVNSALQRARARLDELRAEGRLGLDRVEPADAVQQSLLRRYTDAWEAVDIDGLVAALREDAVMTMPPDPQVFRGAQAIGEFFATVPAEGRLDQIPLVPIRANRQPGLAAYIWDEEANLYRAYGLMVFAFDREAISGITGFPDSTLFSYFGLPAELPADRSLDEWSQRDSNP